MKILACAVVFNEIDILPYLVEHYKANGVEMFIYDNMSTDGTWEYLLGSGVECEQVDTGGILATPHFVRMRLAKWREVEPDWCIYMDADEFCMSFQFPTLRELIKFRDFQGVTVIQQPRLNFRPTGMEDFSKGNPLDIYRYYAPCPGHLMNDRIFKYHRDNELLPSGGHYVEGVPKQVFSETLANPIFHYSIRENGKDKFARMSKRSNKDPETNARGWNTHLKKFLDADKWVWDKDELSDMKDPENELYKAMKGQMDV